MSSNVGVLRRAQSDGEAPCVEIECRFGADYPFSPPNIRVVRPCFCSGTGYVIDGAICMELLTPAGWNATFSIEAILEQVRAHLVLGKGSLVLPDVLRSAAATSSAGAAAGANAELSGAAGDAQPPNQAEAAAATKALSSSYSAAASKAGMDHIVRFHDARGWAGAGKS